MQTTPTVRLVVVLLVSGALCAPPALANDGEIEINQASVQAAGGFPVVLSEAGRYRLTGNLVVSGGSGAIDVTAPGVRIDLGGFSVIGPGSCSATFAGNLLDTVTCAGNAGIGIDSAEEVRNGSVRGFETGIQNLTNPLRLDDVLVSENSQSGVRIWRPAIITDSRFELNGTAGVDGQSSLAQLVVRSSIFRQNGTYGIYVGAGTVDGSVVEQNGSQGIRSNVGRGAVVTNTFFGRNPVGIFGGNTGIRSCTFDENTSDFTATQLGTNLCDGLVCP